MLGAASLRVPIVIDGFIAGAAAAIAQGIRPEAAQYFIGSHNAAEPGHKLIMDHIGAVSYTHLLRASSVSFFISSSTQYRCDSSGW